VRLPPLYAIVDAGAARAEGWTLRALAGACLEGGVRLLQVRAKTLAAGEMLQHCEDIAADARAARATVVVNDRADVARLVTGAGVHVGQDDLPPGLVRALVGPDVIVGFSTHAVAQIDAALAQPISYLAVGPVFGTRTKDTGYTAVGLDLVRYAADAARRHAERQNVAPVPIVAIGGITLETARSVIEAGAASLAVIADLLVGGDPVARVRAYLDRLA
jgi:thiamine-phosphate pyrophosphorylase